MQPFTPPKRFRIVRLLGRGGMGMVHEAFDTERRAHVALKVLQRVSTSSIARFKREFRSLQDIHHPNLVSLGDLISEGDTWFFTMELVDGEDFLAWVTPPFSSGLASPKNVEATLDGSSVTAGDLPPVSVRMRGQPFVESRLRSALGQLASGLAALHEAGKVHRDIKPSNVLITHEGRVVILDFGLVVDLLGDEPSITNDFDVVGTPAYMAPEQAASLGVGPAADWYSVGALLYEALTGGPPFSGAPLEVLMRKQRDEPPAPRALGLQVPSDLDALCTALLRIDPAARPLASEVLRVLHVARTPASSVSLPPNQLTQSPIFVGREPELAELQAAYEAAREGRAVSVLVRGESGIGKSCLVRHFGDSLLAQHRDLVLLAGRCYEREAVPYKAFDGIIDALSRFMARLPAAEAEQLLPVRPWPLVRVFPVLRRVEAIARMPEPPSQRLDPHELRSRAFAGVRELFARLSDRRPVLVVVDDLQWADADSIALLTEVMRPPEAPQLLFVATIRSSLAEDGAGASVAESLAASLPGDARSIDLDRLSAPEARDLAAQLVQRTAPGLPVSFDTIALEADGHPLFIDEIVRCLFSVGAPATGALKLDDALWSRVVALNEPERRLMELVAVAGAPVPQEIAAKAIGMELNAFSKLASYLRVAHLVRTSGGRATDSIEPYHARIRIAVLAHLEEAARRDHHHRIALAMETSSSPDAEGLAIHWQGAGDLHNASKHMLAAADHATQTLAFERAAHLYQYALSLRAQTSRKWDRTEERALQTKLADAMAKAGRGARAAVVYREAAVGANAAEAVDLQRRAAEQLLRSGHLDEGLAAIKMVLASIGLHLPERPWVALVAFLWWRLVLRVRGFGYRATDASVIAPWELVRCDILWSASIALALVDVIRSQLFQTRVVLLSLRLGDPYRVSRALSLEVAMSGRTGGPAWARTQRLAAHAEEVARQTQTPDAMALATGCGATAYYLVGRYREGLERADHAMQMLREQTVGTVWEVTTMQIFALLALAQLGELKELARRVPVALREALDRGDLYAAVNFRIGLPNLVWLVADDAPEARLQVASAMSQWSKEGFHLEHYYELLALTNADLYAGDVEAAHARVASRWSALRRSLVMRVQSVRANATQMRGRCALALAAERAADRSALLGVVGAEARRLERERMPWVTPSASLLRAGVAELRGERDAVLAQLRSAMSGFERADMALHAAVACRLLGARLDGSAEGRALLDEADRWMDEQGVRHPDRFARMIAPGFAPLEGTVD